MTPSMVAKGITENYIMSSHAGCISIGTIALLQELQRLERRANFSTTTGQHFGADKNDFVSIEYDQPKTLYVNGFGT